VIRRRNPKAMREATPRAIAGVDRCAVTDIGLAVSFSLTVCRAEPINRSDAGVFSQWRDRGKRFGLGLGAGERSIDDRFPEFDEGLFDVSVADR